MTLSFVNYIQASFFVQESLEILPPAYQRPPSYTIAISVGVSAKTRLLIESDLSTGLNTLKQQNLKYNDWTVKDYENELRNYTEDKRLILSNKVHKEIAIFLHNFKFHNQVDNDMLTEWRSIAESLRISNSSIHAVYAKFQEYQ